MHTIVEKKKELYDVDEVVDAPVTRDRKLTKVVNCQQGLPAMMGCPGRVFPYNNLNFGVANLDMKKIEAEGFFFSLFRLNSKFVQQPHQCLLNSCISGLLEYFSVSSPRSTVLYLKGISVQDGCDK